MLILFPLHAAKHEKSGMPCSKFWDWIQLIARRYVIILLEIFHQQTKHKLKHVYDFVKSKLEQASGAESSRHEFPLWRQRLYSWATVPGQIALREEFKQLNFQCHTLGSCTYLCHFFSMLFFYLVTKDLDCNIYLIRSICVFLSMYHFWNMKSDGNVMVVHQIMRYSYFLSSFLKPHSVFSQKFQTILYYYIWVLSPCLSKYMHQVSRQIVLEMTQTLQACLLAAFKWFSFLF